MHQQVPPQLPPYQQIPPQGWPQQGHATPRRRRRWGARILFWVFIAFQMLTVAVLIGFGAQQTMDVTFDTLGSGAAIDVALVAGLWLWRQGSS